MFVGLENANTLLGREDLPVFLPYGQIEEGVVNPGPALIGPDRSPFTQ